MYCGRPIDWQDVRTWRKMAWMSALCRSTCQTLMFCLVCNVASYRCRSSASVNDATSIQLNALQCKWKYCDANTSMLAPPRQKLCDPCCFRAVRLSLCQSFCLPVSRFTATVMNRFHCNLSLWLGLYQSEELINFWWWADPGYGFRITFPFPSPLRNGGY